MSSVRSDNAIRWRWESTAKFDNNGRLSVHSGKFLCQCWKKEHLHHILDTTLELESACPSGIRVPKRTVDVALPFAINLVAPTKQAIHKFALQLQPEAEEDVLQEVS